MSKFHVILSPRSSNNFARVIARNYAQARAGDCGPAAGAGGGGGFGHLLPYCWHPHTDAAALQQ